MKAIAQIQAKVPTKVDQREVLTNRGTTKPKVGKRQGSPCGHKSAVSKQLLTTAHAQQSNCYEARNQLRLHEHER